METFNINHEVQVRLLPRGRKIHREHYEQFGLPEMAIKEDSEGWSTWQLWNLMCIFGASCYMGPQPPFETEIRLLGDPFKQAVYTGHSE